MHGWSLHFTSVLPVQDERLSFTHARKSCEKPKLSLSLGQFAILTEKNNLWAGITKRHFNRALLLTLLFRKTWKIHYAAQVQPLNGLKSWRGKKSMAGRHCVKEGYELNMVAHKCNQPYAWLPAATPNQLIGQCVSQVTRVFFFFFKSLLLC